MSAHARFRAFVFAWLSYAACWANAPRTAQAVEAARPTVTWAGIVHDERGLVVSGAEVFVLADYWGKRHQTTYLRSAVSDDQGKWMVKLELAGTTVDPLHCSNVYLFWYKAGHSNDCLHFPHLSHDELARGIDGPNPSSLKLVLPSTHATLSVTAVHGGAPQANAAVRIANEDRLNLYVAHLQEPGDASVGKRLDNVLYPAAHTDERGVAEFADLAPGTYRILAADHDSEILQIVQVDPEGQGRSGGYRGIPVRAGRGHQYTVTVYEQSTQAPLQILQPDGKPASWETTVYEYCHGAQGFGATGSGSWIDDNGFALEFFGKPGLWRMRVREREADNKTLRVPAPCYEATGVLAVSPLLENGPTTVLTSRWLEREDLPDERRSNDRRHTQQVEIKGSVYHADGRTPAFGARILVFGPEGGYPAYQGQTDALGRVHAMPYRLPPIDAGTPTEHVVLAMLPGSCGATIVPMPAARPSNRWSINLPKRTSLQGRVTVGGTSTSSWHNQFRVLAAYEGHGNLDELLSVLVSPESDGSFELAGLTPGRYRIQASMDDIWLSPSVELVVGKDGARMDPLTLNIGRPGVPSVVRCVDAAGEPIVGITVELRRPNGPLTEALWPMAFASDGAGVVHLPPLEAGHHILRVPSLHTPAKYTAHTMTIEELTAGFRPSESKLVIE